MSDLFSYSPDYCFVLYIFFYIKDLLFFSVLGKKKLLAAFTYAVKCRRKVSEKEILILESLLFLHFNLLDRLRVACMCPKGLRTTFLSSYTKVEAGHKSLHTTELKIGEAKPLLAIPRIVGRVFICTF
jgi:hypothetical protein